ncbi:palmitoyltransferase ZDHHC6 isoform X2 [Pristis pectinata]|uniref:palmitoyltransferase ZDHHC6 isoform X2 n=1 Tax=Pristis pectinata TaxID=685728 RepID=UPI00223DE653|nr:palmitoyltransferase ZDHHC6 isoform X2 [Pristis pectinata]
MCSMIKFENLHELKRICHWGPIIALSVIAVCSSMAIIDSVLWYWPLDTLGGSINFIMLINWTVLILYNYFSAMFVGPGYVPIGWKPENPHDAVYLQDCRICHGYKAPRSHHCRKCNRCVMKMDHHCPWINNCCGNFNHGYFTLFLMLAPMGCIHASVILIMTMYTQLYNRMKVILRNKTSIEVWIEEKAKDRIQYYQTGERFIFPYDLGSKWKNFRQVFTWSGIPETDGIIWPVREGSHPYTLTIEQLKQKADKRVRSVQYRVIEDYNGACCPITKGFKTFYSTPCTEEPRIQLKKGELISATRGLQHWMYGDKNLKNAHVGKQERGWFPRKCVEKYLNGPATDKRTEEDKKNF